MKKILILLSFIFLLIADVQAAWNYSYYPNGQIRAQNYTNSYGNVDGALTHFFENGQKSMEQFFSNGKMDGSVTHWYSPGVNMKSQYHMKNDITHGSYRQWGDGAELLVDGYYKDGKREGIWKIFNTNKWQYEEFCFINDIERSIYQCNNECNSGYYLNNTNTCSKLPKNTSPYPYWSYGSGYKCNQGYYQKNNACLILPPNSQAYSSSEGFYCSSGYTKSWGECIKENETKTVKPKNEDKSLDIPPNAELEKELAELDKEVIERYKSGQKKSEGALKGDNKIGKWTYWYDNGQMEKEKYYKDGKLDGKWTQWYKSGQIKFKARWQDNKLDGKVTEWYKSGQKKSEGTAKSDKKNGKWTWWHENGQIHAQGNYKDDELVSTSIYNPVSPIN